LENHLLRYQYDDLGLLEAGTTVEISLDAPANVLLMDAANFEAYRLGDECGFLGGYYDVTPIFLEVDDDDGWYLVWYPDGEEWYEIGLAWRTT
jgi:hypothetical protein